MGEAMHTPGPWRAGRSDMSTIVDGFDSKWIYAGDKHVAVASGHDIEEWNEVMANAHLIAAAPDLLRELEEVAGFVAAITGRVPPAMAATIAKARGRSVLDAHATGESGSSGAHAERDGEPVRGEDGGSHASNA